MLLSFRRFWIPVWRPPCPVHRGATGAFNDQNEASGEDRIREFVRVNREKPARVVLNGLVADFRRSIGAAAQSDDITLVVKVE